jgi:hypothetical protein
MSRTNTLHTQNDLLLSSLMEFYNNRENLNKMIRIINGDSEISLRIVDWFVTNYAKKYYTVYEQTSGTGDIQSITRFKVYNDYKLKLKAYSKKRFDPFCRWDRVSIPYDNEQFMETTIGQLNFFKWALDNHIVEYIKNNYDAIEKDMNKCNSTTTRRTPVDEESIVQLNNQKTRKRREELSISACKCIKKENVQIIVKFN